MLNSSILVAGTAWGKVRIMMDHQNNVIHEANPSDALQIIGWKDLPKSGQEFIQVFSEVIISKIKILCYSIFFNYLLKKNIQFYYHN